MRLFVRCALALAAPILPIPVLATPADAAAAVVRGVHSFPSAGSTRIVVSIDGEFRYRTHRSDDGKSVLVDIEGATLGQDAPRILPISDSRVDGVIVLADAAARIVRVSVDVAGRRAPRLEARIETQRLILDFVDAAAPASPARVTNGDAASSPPASGHGEARAAAPHARVADPRQDVARAAAAAARPAPRTAAGSSRTGTRAAGAVAGSGARRSAAVPAAAAVVASPPPRRSVVQKPVVILDPGHGGKDPGARAWTGEYEKDIVLDLADRVARRLRKRGDIEVVMTRSADQYITLADRRDASRRWDADAFVSIHANASHSAAARGIETYYHSRTVGSATAQAGDRAIRRLARVENRGGRPGSKKGISPASLSSASIPVLDRRAESAQLAKLVQGELVRQLGMRYEAVRDLGAKEGPFFVIGNNAAPSVLVEAAFLTHREEGLRMRSEVYREQIADGVARGIVAFLEQQRRGGIL